MKVLLTGNLGFVGTVMSDHLQSLGHEIVGLDTGFFNECLAVTPVPPSRQLIADVRVVDELPDVDAVVHLAALSNDPLGELFSDVTYDINVTGSLNIARLARKKSCRRFVFASSCSMYGVSASDAPLDEASEQHPQTAYAKSKVLAEREILGMTDEAFAPISLRFATAYGFSPRPRLDIVVNNLIACGIAREQLVLESDGTPWRPLIHVKDMASCVAAALESDLTITGGQAYNVGCDDENFQVRDIARLVSQALGDLPLSIGAAKASDTRSYRVSFERFTKTFPNGVPRERLATGINRLADEYKKALDRNDFDGMRFFRLRQIRHLLESSAIDSNLFWKSGIAYAAG